jgi:hypothetical protein
MIALIGLKLLWFMELEQLYPDEERPWRSRLIGCCSSRLLKNAPALAV